MKLPQPFGLGTQQGIKIVPQVGVFRREDLYFAVRFAFLLAHLSHLDGLVTHSDPSACQK